jgi:pre-mRNA-splicing helicase BRR2
MAAHARAPLDNAKFHDAHTKANLLLQAHYERRPLLGDLARDQDAVLRDAPRLIQVCCGVCS